MDFLVPKLSATMETVKVLRWLKQVGDKVAMGEPLVELETDKATMEVESPVDGILDAVLGAEGEDLSVGAALARLRIVGEAASASETKSTATSAAAAPEIEPASPASQSSGEAPPPRILASPFARRLAKMNGTDLARLAAATPSRRIRGRDVIAAVEARDAKEKLAAPPSAGFEPFSPVRRQIAEAVTLSRKTIPSFVIDRWVETAAIDQARGRAHRPDRTGDRLQANPSLIFSCSRWPRLCRRIPASSIVGMKTMAASARCAPRASTSASSSPFPMGS